MVAGLTHHVDLRTIKFGTEFLHSSRHLDRNILAVASHHLISNLSQIYSKYKFSSSLIVIASWKYHFYMIYMCKRNEVKEGFTCEHFSRGMSTFTFTGTELQFWVGKNIHFRSCLTWGTFWHFFLLTDWHLCLGTVLGFCWATLLQSPSLSQFSVL